MSSRCFQRVQIAFVGVIRNAIRCLISLCLILILFFKMPFYSLTDLAELPVGSAIGLVGLPLVVLIDLRHRVPRDWLHWLGVAIVFTFEILSVTIFLASKLLR